jgi:hypothetical protein
MGTAKPTEYRTRRHRKKNERQKQKAKNRPYHLKCFMGHLSLIAHSIKQRKMPNSTIKEAAVTLIAEKQNPKYKMKGGKAKRLYLPLLDLNIRLKTREQPR